MFIVFWMNYIIRKLQSKIFEGFLLGCKTGGGKSAKHEHEARENSSLTLHVSVSIGLPAVPHKTTCSAGRFLQAASQVRGESEPVQGIGGGRRLTDDGVLIIPVTVARSHHECFYS